LTKDVSVGGNGIRAACIVVVLLTLLVRVSPAGAQQFNSDNYLAMPRGMSTTTVTAGTEFSGVLVSFALLDGWEFFTGAFLSYEDQDVGLSASWSAVLMAKYMVYENRARNGGFAVNLGTGNNPGHLEQDRVTTSFKTFFVTPQLSLPLFGGAVSWDLNPGVQLARDQGDRGERSWDFTYSTRAAFYGLLPESAVVAEVFGTASVTEPQYRVGVRWEGATDVIVPAITWSQGFDGSRSGGFELGFTMFTPRFLCRGGCDDATE
jgi:hypothetical protein